MNITRFFTNILGAKLRTPYRWGAINEMTNHVFLRVWEDGSESVPDGQRILVLPSQPRLVSASYKTSFNERRGTSTTFGMAQWASVSSVQPLILKLQELGRWLSSMKRRCCNWVT